MDLTVVRRFARAAVLAGVRVTRRIIYRTLAIGSDKTGRAKAGRILTFLDTFTTVLTVPNRTRVGLFAVVSLEPGNTNTLRLTLRNVDTFTAILTHPRCAGVVHDDLLTFRTAISIGALAYKTGTGRCTRPSILTGVRFTGI